MYYENEKFLFDFSCEGLSNFASAVMDMLNEETEDDKSNLSEDEDIMVNFLSFYVCSIYGM
jgi:hypothetical protein